LIISKETVLGGGILVTFDVVGEKYSVFITNEETIERCDGTPSQVGASLDYWVDTVQRFCP
jgi:hypothetical protein